jgi:hypothetical protein
MKHLFRQWRLVRYVARRIEKERDDSQSGKWGETYRLQAATVRDDYAKEKHFSSDEAQDLLSACVQDGLIGERLENETTWVWIVASKGQKFRPVFSGLILGELGALGPLWTFLGGAAAACAVIVVVKTI